MKEFINNLQKKASKDFDEKHKYCKAGRGILISSPAQYQCEFCNHTWVTTEKIPLCSFGANINIKDEQDQLIADTVKATLEEVVGEEEDDAEFSSDDELQEKPDKAIRIGRNQKRQEIIDKLNELN